MKYIDVVLPLPLESTFTYAISDEIAGMVAMGIRVLVPLGKSKTYTALCVGRARDEVPGMDPSKVKMVIAVLDQQPVLLPQQMRLWQWMSSYYMAPLGDILVAALPSGLKREQGYRPKTEACVALCGPYQNARALHMAIDMLTRAQKQHHVFTQFLTLSGWDQLEDGQPLPPISEITREALLNAAHATTATLKALCDRGILRIYDREVGRLNRDVDFRPDQIKLLSPAQNDAFNAILSEQKQHAVTLLHGVTSSGKTEIYIRLIAQAISRGEQVLYLLPEIALTVQITTRLQRVFGSRLGIYHSKYSDAERVEIWQKQLSSEPYDIILGARSAVFLPFQRLGLVIVDEEHEASFKQQEPSPRYHARSVAIVMAQMYGAKTILGTATPSVETYYNAQTEKYGLVRLSTRYQGIQLPQIEVVDLKDLHRRRLMRGPFSPALLAAVRQALDDGQQVLLFQNRRGFAPMIECRVCGWVPKCKNCDVSLTYHKRQDMLTCHYCGHTESVPTECPVCGNPHLTGRGYGTEKIEDQLMEIFPDARVARMDLDTTHTRNAYERIISDFSRGKTNVLIGTQMISKGLDFERVAVVGILDADTMLNYPDFRAYEHAFMMMCQVAGRAGRKGQQGRVILQTKNPDLPVVQQVVRNDYKSFYKELLEERQLFCYPPFRHLIYVFLKHKQEAICEAAAQEMGALLRRQLADRVLGPDKPAVARVKTMTIRKIVIKLNNELSQQQVRDFLRQVQQQLLQVPAYKSLMVYYDVDPV